MRARVALLSLLAGLAGLAGLACWPAGTHAAEDDPAAAALGRITDASASTTDGPDDAAGVARLFDDDDATSWCARGKTKEKLTLRLGRSTRLATLELALGHPPSWKATPRVKQVFVSVLDDGKLQKKIRHKWPDGDARRGRVHLDVTGDAVIIEIDQVYAGSGPRGLCLAGVRLAGGYDGADTPIDAAGLASAALGEDAARTALTRDFLVVVPTSSGEAQHQLTLKRGKFTYRDTGTGLEVTGTWKLSPAPSGRGLALELAPTKATRDKKKVALGAATAHLDVWRFQSGAFVPWIAFAVDESGTLFAYDPQAVIAK
jgi:hypothetical protein